MLKSIIDIHASILTKIINFYLRNGYFPDDLKAAEVSPMVQKYDNLEKEHYRPVSLLPHMSKVFERIMYTQIERFMEDKLSNYLQDSEKIIAPNTLINMVEKSKNTLRKGGFVCAMLMDLSKAFGNEPRFIDCQVWSIWFSKRCTFFHEKLLNEKTVTSSCK